MQTRARTAALAALAVLITLAGCGGEAAESGSSSQASTTVAPSTTETGRAEPSTVPSVVESSTTETGPTETPTVPSVVESSTTEIVATAPPTTDVGTTTSTAPLAEPTMDGPLALEGDERRIFDVQLVVTEASSMSPYAAGDTLDRCYTLSADGTFLNPGFPEEGAPGIGTWQRVADDPAGFTARVETDTPILTMSGRVEEGADGTLVLTADVVVSVFDSPVLVLLSEGTEVPSCPA